MEGLGVFVFLAAGAVALFSFLSVAVWTGTRRDERIRLERLSLYRKLAEAPAASAELVLARLREEDAQREVRQREKTKAAKVDSRQGGLVLIAVGVGLMIFLANIAPDSGVWTIGIMVILIGLVLTAFSFFSRPNVDA